MILLKTSFGDIKIELNFEEAPKTAANFQAYVEEGFFNGLIFHRVIDGFMIQGGGMMPDMSEKPKTREAIENEADNGLSNKTGTLAMARTMDPHSA
ncbi:MAG: peptidylprolyl isomerase, partial [Oceanobacter sp.]